MTTMLLTIDQSDDQPLYQQLAASVRRAVGDGTLEPGDSLPATRSAAAALDVNPETVQRAYRLLADEGVVVSRVGRGTRIRNDLDVARLALDGAVADLVATARSHGVSPAELTEMILTHAT